MLDFDCSIDVSPYEYMKVYIEKCPEETDDAKLQWIAETFLGIQKHWPFLKRIAAHMSNELSEEDQDYFMIMFHAITFQISPKDKNFVYKSLFNLSKDVIHIFTMFLANNENLTLVSQLAEPDYDINYITEKIINPLFQWQPYISEMEHNYEEYAQKMDNRKLKLPTIPIELNVLKRKSKEKITTPIVTVPPPNSIRQNKKMLTKNSIDQRLNRKYSYNKEKAENLLKEIKTKNFHFAQDKTERYHKTIAAIKQDIDSNFQPLPKPKKILNKQLQNPIRNTVTTIKRINKRIELSEKEDVQWVQNILKSCRNTVHIEQLENLDREEKEKQRLIDIEKKHLLGQISYEDAILAKSKLQEENKKKYEDFLKEKDFWYHEIEKWKETEMEKNKKQVEKLSLQELSCLVAKTEITLKKKQTASEIKKESKLISAKIISDKNEELEHKMNMIKEIKVLSMIAKKAMLPKIIDLTESSGIGLLCEMSIAELQERLAFLKIEVKEQLQAKKQQIKEEHILAQKSLEDIKESIQNYFTEKSYLRKLNSERKLKDGNSIKKLSTFNKEIIDLKNNLEEKRKRRFKI